MINIWHLLWIIPASAFAGAMALICFVCIAVNRGADEEEKAEITLLHRRMEEDAKEHEEN